MEKVDHNRGFLSVVMSVYNAELFLKESIESILNQTYHNFEFIIINDGSTDNSLSIIKTYNDKRIVLINQENRGLSKSLNTGISIAKAEYIVRMDADDIAYPERLQKQLDFMLTNPSCVLAGSNVDFLDVNGQFLYTSNFATDNETIKGKLPDVEIVHSVAIFKKSAFFIGQQYPEEIFQHFEDRILFNRLSVYGDFFNLPESLLAYRLVPSSISNLNSNRVKRLKKVSDQIILNNFTITDANIREVESITNISKKKKLANYHLRIGSIHLKKNKKSDAAKHFSRSLFYNPLVWQTYLKLIACTLPHIFIKRIKQTSI